MTAPRQTTASNRPDSAAYLAMSGSSNAPGTENVSTVWAPASASAARAPSSSRSASSVYNRAPQTATLAAALIVAEAILLVLGLEHLLVERQPLMVEHVPQPLGLRPQVRLVVGVGLVLDRDLVGDRQSGPGEAGDLLGVVGQDPDAR